MLYSDVRSAFLNFFAKRGHQKLPSGPLVPNDPTLLFANAGMVQFKDVFLGLDNRSYNSATTSQKCLRISGKHNDLEQVGFTKRHHTFFEMLGNFSFGRYFKEGAIPFAWEFLTNEIGLNPDRLFITAYAEDEDAAKIWKQVSGKDVIKISTQDNFWSMGDTGPCGPCSEIYYDHGEKYPGDLPSDTAETGERYVEIWNLVFMQYNQTKDGRSILERPCIDTGMGLERITAVLQGVCDNFDIDVFKSLIKNASEILKNEDVLSPSYRIIADHLRSSSFLIAEGVLPSNEGRGYVLRRVIRRAVRHLDKLCKSDEPLFYRMFDCLLSEMGDYYTELREKQSLIRDTLKQEEEKFKETLKVGVRLLEKEMEKSGDITGDVAFKLYDTYGFPVDLTENIASEHGKHVDIQEFDRLLGVQKKTSKASWRGSGDEKNSNVFYELKQRINPTEFIGYFEHAASDSVVLGIVSDGESIESCTASNKEVSIILDKTPFYAESGGQVGDIGVIRSKDFEFTVVNTLKAVGGIFVHRGVVVSGRVSVGDSVTAAIDDLRRKMITSNHTAIHILHSVLRHKFGNQLFQKGSFVSDKICHLDFNYSEQISQQEILDIEREVNDVITSNTPVHIDVMQKSDAVNSGSVALFDEKYGDVVRVVKVGDYSNELCGGTHVKNTSEIITFKIVSNTSVAAGIRRIEAMTGSAAIAYLNTAFYSLKNIANAMNVSISDAESSVKSLYEKAKELERKASKYKISAAAAAFLSFEKNDLTIRYSVRDDVAAKEARQIIENAHKHYDAGCYLLVVNDKEKNKSTAMIMLTEGLLGKYDARKLAEKVSAFLSGSGGGGRADYAQCGGKLCTDIKELLNTICAN